jgi:heme/copper-type cytochrome/quinol oxidase subunit 2
MGQETVYWFFLTRYWTAWIIALSVIAFQFIVFGFFVKAAEKNFGDAKVVSLSTNILSFMTLFPLITLMRFNASGLCLRLAMPKK